mgnify:CR=1 FL=1
MTLPSRDQFVSAVFLTFSGNCREALTFYQTCFGGTLQLEIFDQPLQGYTAMPVINGSLIADAISIHASDLGYNEGRILGNHMAIFMACKNVELRKALFEKLEFNSKTKATINHQASFIEITDAFEVRWILQA